MVHRAGSWLVKDLLLPIANDKEIDEVLGSRQKWLEKPPYNIPSTDDSGQVSAHVAT